MTPGMTPGDSWVESRRLSAVGAVCSSEREDDDSMMRPAILVTTLLLVGLASVATARHDTDILAKEEGDDKIIGCAPSGSRGPTACSSRLER